jgi:hypothetical protein
VPQFHGALAIGQRDQCGALPDGVGEIAKQPPIGDKRLNSASELILQERDSFPDVV